MLVWAALIHFGRGDVERGRRHVDEAWEMSGAERVDATGTLDRRTDVHAVIAAHIGRAYYHMLLLELDDAIRIAERGIAIADRSGYVVWVIYRLLPILAESCFRAGQIERGEEATRRLRRDSERVGHKLGLAWARGGEAIAPMLRQEWDAAFTLIREAIGKMEEIPFMLDASRLRRELSRRLALVGDRDGALREYRLAHDVFVRLGAEREVEGTREEMRRLGVRLPSRAPPARGMAGLTDREAEIARMVAARKSNKEIGRALGISARTVSTHLSNIFRKVGASSRGELADIARGRS
jgi:DNA-binding CsgD family transcriptional regulator